MKALKAKNKEVWEKLQIEKRVFHTVSGNFGTL